MPESTHLEISQSNLLQKESGASNIMKDFLWGTAYGAVQTPLDGITQLANHMSPVQVPHLEIVSAPTNNSFSTKAGKFAGGVIDFILLQKGLNAAAPGFFGAEAKTAEWLKSGTTGAVNQMMMPVPEEGNFYLNKGRELAIGFGAFAAMGAVTEYMAPKLGKSFLGRVGAGAEGGLTAGTTEVALRNLLYLRRPVLSDLKTIGHYTAFGAVMGATGYAEDSLKAKWNDYKLQKSIETNQRLFNEGGDHVMSAQKQLYDVRFRKITNPQGESVPTLENPGGESAKPGHWVAQRLDARGQVVIENGKPNQWPISESKILKAYEVKPETLASQVEFVAPTKTGGPAVHVLKLDKPLKMTTSWGSLKGSAGDWLANYDFNAALKQAGKDFAIITDTSFKQTYQLSAKK